ncbi:MAG: glycosyltransferase family 2 protein [Candidatus Omnitrophica bacterium]|nr:glycosyltransferase family 2 protein [Candidatus Omnitrophota bacterium]
MMKCDIILPICDQFEYAKGCIESIIAKTYTPYRIIIINNGKDAHTKIYLKGLRSANRCEVEIVENEENIGWVRAINKGIEISDAPYLCFQNDDTLVTDDWLGKMLAIFGKDGRIGIINPTWEGKPLSQDIDSFARHLEKYKGKFIETDWARGFCVLVKREVVDRIGGLDDIFSPAYFDDVDFSVRAIEAGYLCVRALDTYVHHYRNKTFFEILRGPRWNELHEKNKLIYYKRWGRPLKIALILQKEAIADGGYLNEAEALSLYLARKQHRIYLYSPRGLNDKFEHTNIIKKVYPPPLFQLIRYLDIKRNLSDAGRKRYVAIFNIGPRHGDPLDSIKEKVDSLKEETKKEKV